MKKIVALFFVLFMAVCAIGCTENQRAKQWGGGYTVTLPKGQKLVNASWKNDDLWYLVRPMRAGEPAETFSMVEDSSWGLMKGKVTFVESR